MVQYIISNANKKTFDNILIKGKSYMGNKEIQELKYNEENYVVTANEIIRGKQCMSLQAARLIRLLVAQIAKHDTELGIYRCKITDLAKHLGISRQNMYRDIVNITHEVGQPIWIYNGNPESPWSMFHWVETADYYPESGEVVMQLHPRIKAFVIGLDKYFTEYKYKYVLFLKSYYALRLYELIVCEDGEKNSVKDKKYRLKTRSVEFTVTELRECLLGDEKKLTEFSSFRRRAIEDPIEEINKKTDIHVEPIYHKAGRKVTSIEFVIKPNYVDIRGHQMLNDYTERKLLERDKEYENDEPIMKKLTPKEEEEYKPKRYIPKK